MAPRKSPAAAREAATLKLLKKEKAALDALTDYEILNPDKEREKITTSRDQAIEKANTKFDKDIAQLNEKLAPVIEKLRSAMSIADIQEHTGLTRNQQNEILSIIDSDSDASHQEQHSDSSQVDEQTADI